MMAWWLWPFTALPVALANAVSAALSLLNRDRRAPRPDCPDLETVAQLVAEVARCYTGDPLGGLLDYSEHPAHIEWRRQRGMKTGDLPIDCDDVQAYAAWLLHGRPWVRWVRLCNVYEVRLVPGAPNATHAVCWFELVDGTRGILDTNAIDAAGNYLGPYLGPETPTEYCARIYAGWGPWFVGHVEKPWPFWD